MQDDRADAPLPDARKVELNSTTPTTTTTTALDDDDVNNSALPAVKEQSPLTLTEETTTKARQVDGEVVGEEEEQKGDVTRSEGGGATVRDGAGGAMAASERVEEGATGLAAAGQDGSAEQANARQDGSSSSSSLPSSANTTADMAQAAPRKETETADGGSQSESSSAGEAKDAAAAATTTGSGPAVVPIVEPKPSNPSLAAKSALLLATVDATAASPLSSPVVSVTSGTPPPAIPSLDSSGGGNETTTTTTTTSTSAPPAARASPALSTSSGTEKLTAPVKKFSSSLAVNKKFLEKAGEKAKPEVKPVAARLATPPAPAPASSSHPRLLAGKLSASGTLSLSTTAPSTTPTGWNKKPTSPAPSAPSGGQAGAGDFSSSSKAPNGAQNRSGGAVWGSATRVGGPLMGHHGGLGRMANDFPTAAEAAHAKELRAKALLEQMQARERAEQARAAQMAEKNARMLEELDTFRGKHLDPNAAHWDEDEDDFLDTTIEFADGTQYKIEQAQADSAAQSVAGDDELREPGPGELALREKPLPPGEVVVPPKREERFGDDYDRSWPRRPSGAGDGKTLFNERIGRLEPAGSSKRGGPPPPPPAAEPSAILRPRERRPSEGLPHMASHGSEPKARRPSVTSPRASHAALPPTTTARRPSMNEPKPTAWGRRSSVVMSDRPPPPHFGSASASAGAGGRELPPHMLQQQQREQRRQPHPHPAEAPAASASRGPLSPPSQRAPLPPSQSVKSPPVRDYAVLPAGSAPVPTAPTEPPAASAAPGEPVLSLEEMHAREMHAAAERAKKRREEEEQKRLEQIERAKRKAAELEEKMKAADEAKAKAKAEEEKAKAEAKAATAPPPPQPAPPVSAADKVSSWRAVPKPAPAPSQPTASSSSSSSQSVPTRVLAREAAQPRPAAGQAPTKPTSILARPAPPASTPAPQPAATPALPTQASAWRQSQASKNVPSTAPGRQLPPHLAARAAAAEAADSSTPASTQKPPARPSTPPPPPAAADAKVSSPPTSPAHKRDNSQSSKSGYKLPAVAQLDDLMSRIKGAMAPAADGTAEEAAPAAAEEPERVRVKLPTAVAPVETTTVRLPRGSATRASAPSVTPPAIRGRGRGRGRVEAQPIVRSSGPQFESREPTLPFHSSRIARSQSPPPAWRQYTVRLASHPVRRRPQSRQIKNFESQKYPQPLYPFSWYPVLRDANPRRLSRDDLLLPKRYAANGTPIFTVRLGPRVVRRSTTSEKSAPPAPTVSISKKSLVRLPEQVLEPATSEPKHETADITQTSTKPIDAVFGASALSTALGSEESSRASAWRLAAVGKSSTAAQDVSDSAGSLSALSRTSATPTYSMTGELNGEKIEATPRKETAAPGLDAAALRMNPKSPPFHPSDLASMSAAPPAAAWPNKSLALSVLDPTAPSVWSTAPAESSVRIRTISAVQPENSLQGLLDDDPSEVLPSSLAELKSDDGQSIEGKDGQHEPPKGAETKLRAMPPPNFSAFLHESAAAIDPASAAQRPPYYQDGSSNGFEPQSASSPASAYGPPQPYSTHLYPGARGLSQQLYAAYAVPAPAGMSPYVTAAYPSPYSAQQAYHPPTSPIPPTLGYPSPYRESAPASVPHGITNPALIATYGYGQPNVAPRYGAVGAGGIAPMNRSTHNHPSPYARGPVQVAPPTSYIPSPYGGAYQPAGLSPQQQQQPQQQQAYRATSPFGNGSHGSPPQNARYPAPSSTMASPVIVPQQLPPVPSFGAPMQQQSMYPQRHQQAMSPLARAAGIPPYGGTANGYAAYGAGMMGGPHGRDGQAPTRGGKSGAAVGPRGW